jgi:hypothetical protein
MDAVPQDGCILWALALITCAVVVLWPNRPPHVDRMLLEDAVCCCRRYIFTTALSHGISPSQAQWSPTSMQGFFLGACTLALGGHSNAL